jgi:glycosyltransferase involved in cell wall biosynthesis
MKRNKILLIGPFPPPFHGQSVSFKMLVENIKMTESCLVLNLSGGSIGKSGGRPSIARVYDFLKIFKNYIFLLCHFPGVVYLTIAQSRHGFLRDFFFIWLGRLFGCKLVVHLKGGNYDGFYHAQSSFLKILIKLTLRRCDKIVVLGSRLVSMYDFDSKLRNKIIVAENGLPLKNNPKSKAKVLDDTKPFKILFLSNLIESKGYFDVLQAAKILRNNHEISDFEFHFAGQFIKNVDDKTVSSVEDAQLRFELFIKDNNLSSVIKYHGVVSGNDKEKLLEQANIFVLPTNYNNEGQPVSIIEAIAHGLPIITTDYRAINDLVSDGKNGFFVEYGNAEQIAHKIALLIKDAALYSSMSQSSLDYFNEKFTMKKHLARLVPHLNGKF